MDPTETGCDGKWMELSGSNTMAGFGISGVNILVQSVNMLVL
jgi:hypothetical protein